MSAMALDQRLNSALTVIVSDLIGLGDPVTGAHLYNGSLGLHVAVVGHGWQKKLL